MNIKETSFKLYKSNFGKTIQFSMMYGFFIILVLALAFFIPPTLILTVPFVVIPFTFALQVSVAHINNNFPASLKIFFIGYRKYFTYKGFGCYRSLGGFLKALAVFAFYETIVELIGVSILFNKDASFKELFESFASSNITIDSYMSLLDNLMLNEPFMLIMKLATLIGMLFAFYMFAHHIFSHGMKANLLMYSSNVDMPMNLFNAMHKEFFKKIRKEYYKDYYSTIWFLIPIYIVSYIGGACIGLFLVKNADIFQLQIIALAVAFVVSLLFLPLVSTLMEQLYKKNYSKYNQYALESVRDSYSNLMNSKDLSDDQKRSLEEMMKSAEEKMKESNKEENKDDHN